MFEALSDGTIVESWYRLWLPVAAFAAAMVMGAVVLGNGKTGTMRLIARAISALAVLATLPMAIERLGMDLAISNELTVAYLSIGGGIAAVVIGIPSLVFGRSNTELSAYVEEAILTPSPVMGKAAASGNTQANPQSATLFAPAAPKQYAGELVFQGGPNAGRTVSLNPKSVGVSIGRSPDNDVVINDKVVSRHHARITYNDGKYVLEDAGSSNGTLVGGRNISRDVLSHGSAIKIGDTEMIVRLPEPVLAAAKPKGNNQQLVDDFLSGDPVIEKVRPSAPRPHSDTIVANRRPQELAWLAVKSGPQEGMTFQLADKDLTIGRDPTNDIVIEDPGVSRRHARMRFDKGTFMLSDLGSRGGTRVNGQPITGRQLKYSGVLEAGDTTLTLIEVEAASASPHASETGQTIVASPKRSAGVLLVTSGPDSGKSFHLREGDNFLGRDASSGVLLSDPAVSREHCMLRCDGNTVTVYDIGSSTGTKLDGEVVTGRAIAASDIISLGTTEVMFVKVN